MIQEDGKELKAYCMKWDAYVLGGWYCNAWESEDMSLDEERNSDADEVIIVDIDGTLIAGGRGIQKNVDYVNSLYSDYYIYIVTGRPESDEEKTLQELSDAGVQFNDIQFNEDMSIDTPEYKKQTAADILEENPVKLAIDNDAAARSAYASLGIAIKDPKTIKADEAPSIRQVSLDVPTYIRTAARKGLDYYGQGLAGDGLVDRTVREARDMARGEVTEDKVIRTNAWGARHLVDLDAPKNSDPDDKEFPGAGAVAFYLWGINPLNPKPAMNWFMSKAEAIKAERADAPAPPKDQITGSDKNPVGSAKAPAGSKTIELSAAIEAGLENKAKEHNDQVGDNPAKRATVGMLRTVFRRGAGAYSTSHRPGVTRDQWSYARVNAFLYLLRNGRPENANYIGDNDLLPKDHPKSSRSLGSFGTSIGDMEQTVETRRITSNDFELRADPKGNGMSFTGYAAVFNSPSEPLPFIERIAPGAFARSLKSKNNVRMYMNHDSSMLLATTRAKTLRLSEDSKGLLVDASLPDTSIGRDLSVLMQRGDVNSMSFGFTVPSGGDMWSDDGQSRELRQIKLYEVSVVTGFPAYTATTAAVRSLDALATRTGIDVDHLAAAITNLESGQTLSQDHAMLLRETVAKLEPVQDAAPARLGVMAKHLDLLKTIA
jgi:HK97 family phage prohead protease